MDKPPLNNKVLREFPFDHRDIVEKIAASMYEARLPNESKSRPWSDYRASGKRYWLKQALIAYGVCRDYQEGRDS